MFYGTTVLKGSIKTQKYVIKPKLFKFYFCLLKNLPPSMLYLPLWMLDLC